MWSSTLLRFGFTFAEWLRILSLHSRTYWPFVYLLWGKHLFRCHAHFLTFFVFFCYWVAGVVYIFWVLDSYQMCYLQMFSPILWVVLIVSFDAQMFLNFDSLIYLIFLMLPGILVSNEIQLPCLSSWKFSIMFSSRSFLVLGLTFRTLVHFEQVYVCVRWESSFTPLHMDVQVVPAPFVGKTSLTIAVSWHFCWKSTDCRCMSLFLGSQLYHTDLSVLVPVP